MSAGRQREQNFFKNLTSMDWPTIKSAFEKHRAKDPKDAKIQQIVDPSPSLRSSRDQSHGSPAL
jgi:hypothetical protein